MADMPTAAPAGRCAECNGSGGEIGSRFRCPHCDGTGGPARPPRRWLDRWSYEQRAPRLNGCTVITGVSPEFQRAVLFDAMDDPNPAPRMYVVEGPDVALLEDRRVMHYDLTGRCQAPHPHVVWDPASADLDDLGQAVQELARVVVDPIDSWQPPPWSGDFAAQIHPDMFVVTSIATIALWTAGASRQGTRSAMEWLSAGQLGHMTGYCQTMAQKMGRPTMPLLDFARQALAGPPDRLQAAVQAAWQMLAPVEESIRMNGGRAGRLDLATWLTDASILAVSLPAPSSVAHRQLVVAVDAAAERVPLAQRPWPPQVEVIWHEVSPPHTHGGGRMRGDNTSQRWLVLVDDDRFTDWARGAIADDSWSPPDWVIGPKAGPGTRQAAQARLGSNPAAPLGPGDALLLRNIFDPTGNGGRAHGTPGRSPSRIGPRGAPPRRPDQRGAATPNRPGAIRPRPYYPAPGVPPASPIQ